MNKHIFKMIDRLKIFMDNAEIEYGKYSFKGLILRKYVEYPWKNEIEHKAYYARLYEDKSEFSMQLYIRMFINESLESIHIWLSRKFIARFLAVFPLVIALILLILGNSLGTIISSSFCLLMLLVSFYSSLKAKGYYQCILISPPMIELIFSVK